MLMLIRGLLKSGLSAYRPHGLVMEFENHLADFPGTIGGLYQDVINRTSDGPSVTIATVGDIVYMLNSRADFGAPRADHPNPQAPDKMPRGIEVIANFATPAVDQALFWDYRGCFTTELLIIYKRLPDKITLQAFPLFHILQLSDASYYIFDLLFIIHFRFS